MLTRIELTNFMSHESTVIEPAAGLTVLTGPNNCGKSAVVTALQILCHNENSTYVLRHGEKECAVKVETDDGHVVEWRRRTSPSYTIDGNLFDRLRGAGLPDELHAALRLPKVDAGNDADFDVHFGTQKAPVFLLGSSSANAARFFASSSDAIRLVQMQRRHKEKLTAARSDLNHLEAESKQLNDELERLEPVVELDARLTAAEQLHDALKQDEELLAQALRQEESLRQQARVAAVHRARLGALDPLAPPPTFEDVQPLADLRAEIAAAVAAQSKAAARNDVLTKIPVPPDLSDVEALERLVQQMDESQRIYALADRRSKALTHLENPPQLVDETDLTGIVTRYVVALSNAERCRMRAAALADVAEPPLLVDIVPLTDFATRFQRVSEEIWQRELALRTVEDEWALAEAALREFAISSTCETCGAPLDPERVLARAAAGLGGHDHGE